MLSFTLILSVMVYAHHASALTSLFVPGFDPQPVTANLLGSQDSVTSYVIAPGVPSAGMDDYGFEGPATLVVGPTTAALTYIDEDYGLALYENCDVTDGVAVCEDVVIEMGSEGFTMTQTVTQAVESFAVQGGDAATGAAAITTSPVPTGDFATWTADYDDFGTISDDDDLPTASGSQAAAITPTPTGGSSGASRSGMSRVPTTTSDASGSGTSSGDAQQTNQPNGGPPSHFRSSGLLTVVVAAAVGALVVLA